MKKRRRLHSLEIAAEAASFDILGYTQQKFKEALLKKRKAAAIIQAAALSRSQ